MAAEDAWHMENARRSEAAFKVFRLNQNLERRAMRKSLPLEQRVALLLGELRRVQIAPVLNVERSAVSSNALHLPYVDEGIGFLKPDVTVKYVNNLFSPIAGMRRIACERLEAALDDHRGMNRLEAHRTKDELDARILNEFEHYSPDEITALEPALGDAKSIWHLRESHNRDPITGSPNP
jgi:hypothetical protein